MVGLSIQAQALCIDIGRLEMLLNACFLTMHCAEVAWFFIQRASPILEALAAKEDRRRRERHSRHRARLREHSAT